MSAVCGTRIVFCREPMHGCHCNHMLRSLLELLHVLCCDVAMVMYRIFARKRAAVSVIENYRHVPGGR